MSDDKSKRVEVKIPDNVPVDFEFERMLKSFLKQVQKEGKLEEVKKRRYYTKPSEIKRMKDKENQRRKK